MSPEALSSLFQQRPMRPLPKRRLRERLSPDVADSIEYPPASQNSSPLFLLPGIVREERSPSVGRNYTVIRDPGYEGSPSATHEAGESDEEELKRFASSKVVRRSHPEILNRSTPQSSRPGQPKHANHQPPASTTSSVDGYDSFENTNNKKKRKIPTAGDNSLGGTHTLADITSLGITATAGSPTTDNDLSGPASPSYYGSAGFVANNQGISGPGRGRFGRSRNGRSPLRALSVSEAANSWVGRGPKIRQPQWAVNPNEHTGIISNAIANAGKLSSDPGQENISLLSQHSGSSKPRPASAQFTFTCDSQVPGTQWPGMDPATQASLPAYAGGNRPKHASMATQTPGGNTTTGAPHHSLSTQGNVPAPAQLKKKKSRRRAEKDLKVAAAQRRHEAQEKLYHNPPRSEDMWVCEFCEYERIFGEPPYALIRQYEIKDQKARRQEQERKRLLEKAKAKSRKGKKPSNGKPATKTAESPQAAPQQQVSSRVDGGQTDGTRSQTNSTDEDEEGYRNGDSDFDNRSFSHEDPPMTLSDDPDPEYPDEFRLACPCVACVTGDVCD
ncbi:hypothetical protein ACHAQA_002125 [Verticillium albo-atrum]